MSHEFRTPLNSILALTRLLLDEMDGPLSAEQTVQVTLVRKAAQDLSELVNDLLDLAKVEAGKIVIRPTPFQVSTLFGALRGMLRPLLVAESVNLVFEEAAELPALFTDEAKVSQILRNFVSNALKFTERGEVRVSAAAGPDEGWVTFAVADTGIGIPEEDQERIFQEFTQLEHPMQKRVRGTGLGLPLSRKLAQLLGGDLQVVSTPGLGSTFYARLPITYPEAVVEEAAPEPPFTLAAGERLVLVVEDAPEARMLYERLLAGTTFRPLTVSTVREAKREIQRQRPSAIILDIVLRHEDSWKFLADLKADEVTASIPVLIVSTIDDRQKGLSLGADAYAIKPVSREWLLARLAPEAAAAEPPPDHHDEARHDAARPAARRVLIVDDDPAARYVLRRLFAPPWEVFEAPDGASGVRMAQELRPTVMFLDLAMPRMSGVEVLRTLRAQPATARIPVIIATSMALSAEERDTLALDAAAVLAKDQLARSDAASIVEQALALAGVASLSAPRA